MPRRTKHTMLNAVKRAVAAATHLEPEDEAQVQVALQLAAVIDSAANEDDPAAWRKQVGWIAPHLNATLRMLGLSPETRKIRDEHKVRPPDALDRLRAARRAQLPPDEQARLDGDSSRLTEIRRAAIGWAGEKAGDDAT